MTWAGSQTTLVDLEEMQLDTGMDERDLQQIDGQLYTIFASLTDGESFDVTTSAGPGSGLESWRRLCRRWDPYTTGRARPILRDVHSPARANIQGLQSAIGSHEDLMRRYCSRRDSAGVQCSLSEDIRMASLEALLPEELERHIHMTRSRILSCEALREEVVAYAEARGSDAHHPPARRGQDRGNHNNNNHMDVDTGAFDRKGNYGKGNNQNGKGKGSFDKKDVECWNCGKRGHMASECRQDGGGGAVGGAGSGRGKSYGKENNKGSFGKKGKSTNHNKGKHSAHCLEENADEFADEADAAGQLELCEFSPRPA